jgi:hypothetical protein
MSPRQMVALGVACIVVAFCVSLWLERRRAPTPEQAAQRARTELAVQHAAQVETVYVAAKATAASARTALQPKAEAVLANPTDTVRVKEFVTETRDVLVKDSVALAAADVALAGQKKVTASVRAELALALRPRRAPRLSGAAMALYDPITQTPIASLTASFRVIGRVSLVARGEQRFALGERPYAALGVAVAF